MKFATALLLAALVIQPVLAKAPPRHDSYNQTDESELIEHGSYTNKNGENVHSPTHTPVVERRRKVPLPSAVTVHTALVRVTAEPVHAMEA